MGRRCVVSCRLGESEDLAGQSAPKLHRNLLTGCLLWNHSVVVTQRRRAAEPLRNAQSG